MGAFLRPTSSPKPELWCFFKENKFLKKNKNENLENKVKISHASIRNIYESNAIKFFTDYNSQFLISIS